MVIQTYSFIFDTNICLQLTVSLSIYVSSKKKDTKWMWPSFQKALPFSVPGILYSINNNLSVLMQAHMDPATYQVIFVCVCMHAHKCVCVCEPGQV